MAAVQASPIPSADLGRRVVLCFDGTGNVFQAKDSDTNVVKLYEMLDRKTPGQFHYYQPGIGTYTASEGGGLFKYWSSFRNKVSKAVDQGIGTTFRDHVLAGYKFLMRYYEEGDDIYVFGFSRGAYTARFLSQMIFRVGLLSRGNEEMMPFAWSTFSEWLTNTGDGTPEDLSMTAYMQRFKSTFCRDNVIVTFLGLWDCVNSVGSFELPFWKTSYKHMPLPPAKYIRHAVSIHERRLKFKPALFSADLEQKDDKLKEVWFCGNHADIGGGWGYENDQPKLLSDEPLQWMIDEVLRIPVKHKLRFQHTTYVPKKPTPALDNPAFFTKPAPQKQDVQTIRQATMRPHDMLSFGAGTAWFGVLSWWILEVLPFFSRLELEYGKWIPRHWPPNMGAWRDLPEDAVLHHSVYRMHRAGVLKDLPKLGGDGPPTLSGISSFISFNQPELEPLEEEDQQHAKAT